MVILVYLKGWFGVKDFVSATKSITHQPLISVIVAARNEEKNIGNLLASLSEQNYPAHLFEVIVVDDHSDDETVKIAENWISPNFKISVLRLEYYLTSPTLAFKKKAIETGILNSVGELIVTTDADCTMDKFWLSTIAAFYELHQPHMIVMPVVIEEKGSFFKRFQMTDFMVLQGITAAVTYFGIQGMCNGANLAYTRAAFNEVNGFDGIDKNASGDDMMLLHKMKKHFQKGILYLKSKQVIVRTLPQETIGDFFNQRIRWAGKSKLYSDKGILPVLLLVYFFNCALLIAFFFAIFQRKDFVFCDNKISVGKAFSYVFILKILIELFFLIPVADFYNKRRALLFFPLMQPFHIIYTLLAGTLGAFNSYTWKNRKLR
jgi:cellulose synthase/poly-beta-1,6-N-acetylglucosamine synthase-like glycosyltransferase